MKLPENNAGIHLRLFDLNQEWIEVIGVYENITVQDLNVPQLLTDLRKSFNKSIKRLEIDLDNAKKGLSE